MEALKQQLETIGKEYSSLLDFQLELKRSRLQLFRVTQNLVNPFLINSPKERTAFYENGIVHVVLDNGKTDEFYFNEDKNVIDAFFKKEQREELVFWLGSGFFNVAKKVDHEIHKLNQAKLQEVEQKLREKRLEIHTLQTKIECIEFWEQYSLPFKFIADIKIVLSGLSESSDGNGCKSNTVRHVVLKEDYSSGALKRKENQYLCSQQKGFHMELDSNTKAEDIQHVVTCKECLKRIEKYKKG